MSPSVGVLLLDNLREFAATQSREVQLDLKSLLTSKIDDSSVLRVWSRKLPPELNHHSLVKGAASNK